MCSKAKRRSLGSHGAETRRISPRMVKQGVSGRLLCCEFGQSTGQSETLIETIQSKCHRVCSIKESMIHQGSFSEKRGGIGQTDPFTRGVFNGSIIDELDYGIFSGAMLLERSG